MTARKVELTPSTLITCDRCGKSEFLAFAAEQQWNYTADKGHIVGFLCHDCQTDEEDLEAQVNESLIDYSRMAYDEQGRLTAPLKVDKDGSN